MSSKAMAAGPKGPAGRKSSPEAAAAHPGYWAGLLARAGTAPVDASIGNLNVENCRLSFFDRESIEGLLLGIDHDARMVELRLAHTAELQSCRSSRCASFASPSRSR